MANRSRVYWVSPPTKLAHRLNVYDDRVRAAIVGVAQFIALKMQNEARQNAKWQDRTGNARTGLLTEVDEVSKELVSIYLGHSVKYGQYLELNHGGKYAIIMPTIEANLPEIKRMLDKIFS